MGVLVRLRAGVVRAVKAVQRRGWPIIALGAVALVVAAAAPSVAHLSPFRSDAERLVTGDTITVWGPQQFTGSSGQGQTYVEQFTATVTAGRLYTLHLVNGAPNGTQRASKVIVKLNGYEVVAQNEVTQAVAALDRTVALTAVDTIRVTVAGSSNPYITLSVLSTPDSSFDAYGPNQYAVTSGSSTTHNASFSLPSGVVAPYRVYVTNGASDGTLRATSAAITLNGTQIVTTTELTSSVGSLTKTVTLNASNTLGVTVNGAVGRYITVRFTATDTTKPTLTITAPAPNALTNASSIAVSGMISDQTATTVTVNGTAATVTNNTSYTATVPLPNEGSNLLTVVATDATGRHTDSTRTVIRDTQAPSLAVSTPADGAVTKNATITVTATASDANGVTVNTNGTPLTAGGGGSFSGSVALAQGSNVLTTTATDGAGNTTSIVRTVTRDTVPPVLTVSAPADGTTTQADSITVSGTVSDALTVTVAANGVTLPVTGGNFSGKVALAEGPNTISVVVTDAATNSTTVNRAVTRQPLPPPPDPATLATPIDPTVAPTLAATTAFLYTGPNAIQTGVAPGTIQAARAAVLRGRVLDTAGVGLPGVTVTVLGRPEFGQTRTQADGDFDLAVNGGGLLTVVFAKSGYLGAQRSVEVPWQDYATVDSLVLIRPDTAKTVIDFSQPIQAARGSPVTDADGTRRATLLFEQGTQAAMVLPNGTSQPLSAITVRATEFTVGADGPTAMPAALPAASGYTYAAELSVDEAMAAGATTVTFSKGVAFYLENFIGLPVGSAVPFGYYDRQQGRWVPEQDGRVIKVLSITGGRADLDLTGSNQAADAAALASLGITDAEREQLAALYPAGQTLWRTEHTHFTPGDWNLPFGPPEGAKAPDGIEPYPLAAGLKCQSKQAGSIIGCEHQTLGEALPVTGTPFALWYQSDRAAGYRADNTLIIPVSGPTLPPSLESMVAKVEIAGRRFGYRFLPTTNFRFTFAWDGLDAYGRVVRGQVPVTIATAYEYNARYAVSGTGFGGPGTFMQAGNIAGRSTVLLWRVWKGVINASAAPDRGLGGWSLDVHHAYDPAGNVLHLGDGTRRTPDGVGRVATTLAGTGAQGFGGDGGVARTALLNQPEGVEVGPDGSVYIADKGNHRIRRVTPQGTITTVAGSGSQGSGGDGGPATQAALSFPRAVAVGPDGSLYIVDASNSRIRRVTPAGVITTFAGGACCSIPADGDGGPATAAQLFGPHDVAVAADGSVYIAEYQKARIRRVSPAGIISTFAGTGVAGFTGDNGPATSAKLSNPISVAVGPDGSVYVADYGNARIRRVTPDGLIRTIAGGGTTSDFHSPTEGLKATEIQFWNSVLNVAVGPDGVVYFVAQFRARRIDLDGTVTTVVGSSLRACTPGQTTNCQPPVGEGALAPQASFLSPLAVAAGADGALYVSGDTDAKVARVAAPLPGFSTQDFAVASEDGAVLYQFSPAGRHLRTLDGKSGATLVAFVYDSAGRLSSVAAAGGDTTRIERTGQGTPTAIVAPYGQRTTLTLDGNGHLASVTDPAGQLIRLATGTTGLLDSLTDARGRVHRFTYDSLGRLTKDEDPAGGYKMLALTHQDTAFSVAVATRLGRTTTYRTEQLADGRTRRTRTEPTGLKTVAVVTKVGETTATAPDSTVTTSLEGADPRFGMQAPLLRSLSVRLPSGLTSTLTAVRRAVRPDSTNPLSLTTQTDSVRLNNRLFLAVYDAATRRVTSTTPEGRQTFTTLDSLGRVRVLRTPGLDSVVYAYDARGRLEQVQAGGRVASYGYDSKGRLQSTLDPPGRRDSLFYDDADRLVRRVLPGGRVVQFAYDSAGNLTGLTPPSRPAHTFRATAVDLDSLYTPPSLGAGSWATEYRYNFDRQLTEIRRPDSVTIAFGYDTAGRASTVTFDRGQVGLGYSATTGNLTSLTAPGGINLSFTYDGALPKTAAWAGPVAGSVGVGYNTDFRVTSQTVNGANSVSFGYDGDGLLTSAGALGLKRQAQTGFLERDSVGTVLGTWSYDAKGALAGYTAASGGTTLVQTSYVRDSLSRITQLTETVQGTTAVLAFTYDSAGRLSEVRRDGQLTATYAYDANGNRLTLTTPNGTVTGSYDDQDRLTSYGTANYGYTRAGTLRWKAVGTDTTHYTYDALGNLTAVTLPDGTAISYLIDGQNRRVGKKVNGVLVQGFLYQSPLAPVAELDGAGAVVSRFVYATRVNVPDYLVKAGVTYRLVLDHLGSVRLVVNTATGAVVQRLDYDEFGRVTQNTNPGFQPFGYAGGLLDDATGLVRFGARDYDPATGRWTAKDPIGFMGGSANLYTYVGNDPISYVDPSGLAWDLVDIGFFLWSLRDFACNPGLGTGLGLGLDAIGLLPIIPSIGYITRADDVARLGKKLDFFLGKAAGSEHNVRRSESMLAQLNRIGLGDTPATRDYLTQHLNDVLRNPSNIREVTGGGRTIRESLLMGPLGGAKLETVWDGNKLITGILSGGR